MALSGNSDDYVKLINIEIFKSWSDVGTALVRSQYCSEVKPHCAVLPQAAFPFSSFYWKDNNGVIDCSGKV